MNFEEYIDKIVSIKKEIQKVSKISMDERSQNFINNLVKRLDIIKEFLDDQLNKKIISNNTVVEFNTPLGNICKDINQKFDDLNELFEKSTIFLKSCEEKNQFYISKDLDLLNNKLQDCQLSNYISSFKILRYLDGHDKTLIIVGPNGSGKTSLANYLKRLDTHVKVIPALKPLRATGYTPRFFSSTLKNFNHDLYEKIEYEEDLLQKLIVGLCNEHDEISRKYYKTNIKEESQFERVKKIIEDFFDIQLDDSCFGDKKIKAKKQNNNLYDFNNMSDGERAAFFYIATVIAAPNQSFIIVDEPENHLNPAIYNKIWNRLINLRKDCQFIFISHTIDFINARSNFELVKIKSFVYPDKFEFQFLGNSLENIPIEYIVEILGSRKPMLFCEGDRSGYDYKIYEKLFGEKYTVLATGNCLNVENCVKACNIQHFMYSTEKSIGIIDSDMKSEEEILALIDKSIYCLKCNEIEMLLLDEIIFKKVLKRLFKNEEELNAYKKEFFEKINARKDYIIRRFVKTKIDENLKKSVIDDKNNITKEEIRSNLYSIFESIKLDDIWDKCEAKITNIISNKNYEEAIRYCCLEHKEIIGGVVNKFVKDYENIALGLLTEDDELSSVIRNKYFSEITCSQEQR